MSLIDEKKVVDVPVKDVIDIDLSSIKKKRFRINGDNSKILELNTSDMGIFGRLRETYPKLEEMINKAVNIESDNDEGGVEKFAETLKEIDASMRESMDYIFDTNISEVCASEGSMYDPLNGKFRYEHILETISKLYENNFESEVKKLKARTKKYTSKYAKKYHK